MATDPVLRPVDRGLGPNLQKLAGSQRVGDGQTDPGAGSQATRAMTGRGAEDASTAGGYKDDSPGKYSRFPAPLRGLIQRLAGPGDDDSQVM